MKYQDCSTQSQAVKIDNLLSRLRPTKSMSQVNYIEFNSKLTNKPSSNTLRLQKTQSQKVEPLSVDRLQHYNHNILVFVPSTAEHLRTESSKETRMSRKHKFSSTRSSSKFSAFRQSDSAKNSFRVKKLIGLREEWLKQNRTPFQSGQSSARPVLQESRILKKSSTIEEEPIEEKKQQKKKVIKQMKPPILKYFINHTELSQLEEKFKGADERLRKSQKLTNEPKSINNTNSNNNNNSTLKQNKIQLFSNVNQRIKSVQPRISFFLNSIFSYNQNLIKRLFGQKGDIVKLILNYEGCFRSLSMNLENLSNHNFIWNEGSSLWASVLDRCLCVLLRKGISTMTIKSLYQMLTGLVLQQIQIKQCSEQRLLEIISCLRSPDKMIIGETLNGEYSTTVSTQQSLEVKRYILESVYTQFQPSPEMMVPYYKKYYKTLYIADLYPEYYFIYKKIDYSLGTDSVFYLQVQDATTIIFEISKQTTAFDAKIKLTIEQNKEQGVEEYCNQPIKSSLGIKKQLTLLEGKYCIRLSDEKQNMKEYKFSFILSIVCKKDISRWIKEN